MTKNSKEWGFLNKHLQTHSDKEPPVSEVYSYVVFMKKLHNEHILIHTCQLQQLFKASILDLSDKDAI